MNGHIHYQEYGYGEMLVMLPSFWLTSRSYRSIAQKLAERYRVIVPDLYRGESRFSRNAFTVDDYVEQLHGFFSDLRISKCYLLGISFSSLIASKYLARYPDDIDKIILVSTFAPPSDAEKYRLTFFRGLIAYMKLIYHNLFFGKGIKINMLWLFDSICNYFLRHPRQFFLDVTIALRASEERTFTFLKPTRQLIADKDEFIPYGTFDQIGTMQNLEMDTIEGFHAWFFLHEDLFVEKVCSYFVP